MTSGKARKVNYEPRISLNNLAEYLSTNKTSRRERILQDTKYPPTFQTIRYDPTREIIQRYISGAIPNTQALQVEIAKYSQTVANEDFQVRMNKSNEEAMTSFLTFAPTLDFEDATLKIGRHAPERLPISGVSISVRPDLTITSSKKGTARHGGIKLNISKSSVHTKDSAEYAGAILRHYLTGQKPEPPCDYRLCYSLDVFGSKNVESLKAVTNRLKDVAGACAEIARQWDAIEQP